MSPPQTPRTRRAWAAPLTVGLLVAVLLGGITATILAAGAAGTGTGTGDGLPDLRLISAPEGAAVDAPVSGSARAHYLLAGSLPGRRPDPSAVYRIGPAVSADSVQNLARALGIGGSPRQNPAGWQVTDGRRVLVVDMTGNWQLGPGEVSIDSRVQCFRAPCPHETTDSWGGVGERPAPSPLEAKRIATDALTALGRPAEDLQAIPNGRLIDVRAPRQVAGKDATGFGTTLSVGGDGKIYSGQGWLGQPARGPAYPLVTAAAAFKRLQAQPFAEDALCRPLPGGGCAPAPQARVTGAKLGLQLAIEKSGPMLVPAWLFTIAGQVEPVAAIAVEERHLAPPVTTKPGSPSGERPATGGGTMPGTPPAGPSTGKPSVHNPATPPS